MSSNEFNVENMPDDSERYGDNEAENVETAEKSQMESKEENSDAARTEETQDGSNENEIQRKFL